MKTKTKTATIANSNPNPNTNLNENVKETVATGLTTANLTRHSISTSITNSKSRQQQQQTTSPTIKERFRHKLRRQKQLQQEQQRQQQKNQEQQFDKKKVYCHRAAVTAVAAVAAMERSTKVVDDRLSLLKNHNNGIDTYIETENGNENAFSFNDDNHAVEDNNNDTSINNNNKITISGIQMSPTSHNTKFHNSSSMNKNKYHDPIDLTATTTNDNDDNDEQQRNNGRHHLATRVPVAVSSRAGMASPGIDDVRRRRQLRLRRRESDLEREQKPQQQQQQQKNQLTTSMTSTTTSKVTEKSAVVPILSPTLQHNEIGGIDLDSGDGNSNGNSNFNSNVNSNVNSNGNSKGNSDNNNTSTKIKDDSNVYNDGDNDDVNNNDSNNMDRGFFSVSLSKKIRLLKRHDAGGGGTPLSAVPVQVEGPSLAVQAPQKTQLEGQNNPTSRRRRQEEEEEEEVQVQYPRLYKHKHLDSKVNDNRTTGSNNDIHDLTSANNTNNTRRLKECVARSRLSHRTSNKYNHDTSVSNDLNGRNSYGEMLLKRHFRSGSISCSSVSTTGTTSTVSGVSVSSSKSNHSQFTFQSSTDEEDAEEDEEGTTITSTSGSTRTTTGDGDCDNNDDGNDDEEEEEISQLLIPVEVSSSHVTRNLSSSTPSLVKHHPQHHLTTATNRSRPTTDRKRINVETHEENDPSSVNQNKVLRNADEQQRKQQSLIPIVDSTSGGQSAVATILKATTDVATTVSSALTNNLLEQKQQESTTNRIKLHVYDLVANDTQLDLFGCNFPLGEVFNAFNSTLHSIGTGAYHVGLEVSTNSYLHFAYFITFLGFSSSSHPPFIHT